MKLRTDGIPENMSLLKIQLSSEQGLRAQTNMIDRIGCIDRKTGYLDIQTLIRSDFYLRITGKDERFYVVLKIH